MKIENIPVSPVIFPSICNIYIELSCIAVQRKTAYQLPRLDTFPPTVDFDLL